MCPSYCPNPTCPNHHSPHGRWLSRYGFYHTDAHGAVQRYICRACKKTVSTQSESVHYFAKRRLPLRAVAATLTGCSLREVARRYRVTPTAIRNAVFRIGRQSMAAQMHLLWAMKDRQRVVYDGLRSFITSQDYPCDITTAIDGDSETILTMVHSIMRRGGKMSARQRDRITRKYALWQPQEGSMTRDIRLLTQEIWGYLAVRGSQQAIVDTDRHFMYHNVMEESPVAVHLGKAGRVMHRRTSAKLPRTRQNPLFPANYVDLLLRHREKEHTRETIAFGRHAVVQMHRAWIFAWDHNGMREYRVRHPEWGVRSQTVIDDKRVIGRMNRQFYQRRIRLAGVGVPYSMRQVWEGKVASPPVKWRKGGVDAPWSMVRIPAYALRDLAQGEVSPAPL